MLYIKQFKVGFPVGNESFHQPDHVQKGPINYPYYNCRSIDRLKVALSDGSVSDDSPESVGVRLAAAADSTLQQGDRRHFARTIQ